MKREIKFRGKDIYTEEWIYGNLVNIEEDRYAVLPVINTMRGETIAMYEVSPDTVGQFTGLCDAQGKEIYEGDVILEDKDPTMLEIVFRDGIFFASIGNTRGENPYMNCALHVILARRKARVIGNIHDNPELLKGGDND